MVATGWYSNHGPTCLRFFARPYYDHVTCVRGLMDQFLRDAEDQRLQMYFNFIYPWWLQIDAIRTFIQPLEVKLEANFDPF